MGVVNGIHHVSMKCCNDAEYNKTVTFYRDVLGLPVARTWNAGIMFDTGSGLLEVFNNGEEQFGKGVIRHFAFATKNVDACVQAVKTAGYEVFLGPKEIAIPSEPVFPAKMAFCYGPLGEEIEFFQERDALSTNDACASNKEQDSIKQLFEFRSICAEETEQAIAIEQICFPPNEACSAKSMRDRIAAVPELFLVAIDKSTGQIAGFLNGIATSETAFRDDFFTDSGLHEDSGKQVMLLGLDVLPAYRLQGLAREIVARYAQRERENGRERLVLTCLEDKVEMYEKLGLKDLGMADSTWGGEAWHEMVLEL